MKRAIIVYRLITVVSFILALPLTVSANMTPTQMLSQRLQAYNSLSGRFEQTLLDAKGERLQQSSGAFRVQHPGYFRWETQQPFPQLLVSNLETIWLYDPDLAQVTLRPYSRRADQSPALLLSGDADLIARHYDVHAVAQTPDQFVLQPKDRNSPFTQIELQFTQGYLTQMVLHDSLQQTTTFSLTAVRTDLSLPPDSFTFVPPPGVDVLIDE